ncbi:hypothetical protein CC80DRAFT_173623 [Byssothecium circinans]|uniref:Uncharacterized protein n=1 Tax=Byssothecium circinans TaxID=147558 RepID=A0A6A5THW9_9PLEO|nr:hypothetical protein CC80DRAFT_173623 [Byssothecium circinans]
MIGSEASTSSLAYSFYELPDSRHSSSVYSQTDLGQAQFDGAAASRQASRGAYHSIRLPHQHHATSGVHSQTLSPSRTPSSSTPDLAVTQHGFSPVPTNPYTRGPNGQYAFRPLITQDNLLGGEQDAVEAITRELSSPLELVEERATSYLQRVSAQRQIQQAQATGYTTFQHQISEVEAHSDSNYGYSSAGTHYQPRYTVPRPHSQHHPYGQRPFNAGEQPVHTLGPPARRRAAPTARAGQRSSENAPVNSSFNLTTTLTRDARPHTHATSNLPAPTQRTSLVPRPNPPGMRSNGAPGRVSHAPMLYPPRPRDISNRPHPAVLPPDDDTGSSDGLTPTETYARPGGMGRGPRIPPRYASRGSGITYTHPHANPNRIITPTPTPLPHQHAQTPTFFNHPPSRGPPSTSTTLDIASGITSRGRPAIPMSVVGPASAAMSRPLIQAPTIRRVHISQRPHRRELENSADSEIGVVEGGSSAVTRRFDDVDSGVGGEGGDEMTETSPGLGKFERRVNG